MLLKIVAEGLNSIIKRVYAAGYFNNVMPNDLHPIAQFVDDTVIMGEGSMEQIMRLKGIIAFYERISGQRINWSKYALYGFDMEQFQLEEFAEVLKCKIGNLPDSYLGLPMFSKSISSSLWDPVVERMRTRLSTWKGKLISKGGRLVLLKACLMGLPTYALSFLHCPMKTVKQIEGIMRNFLWKGSATSFKHHLVKWMDVCKPKFEVGLGIRKVDQVNKALLLKWSWKINTNGDAPWAQMVKRKINSGRRNWILDQLPPQKFSVIWRYNQKLLPIFKSKIRMLPGIGNSIFFWKDCWIMEKPLMDEYPRLYAIARRQDITIAEIMGANPGNEID